MNVIEASCPPAPQTLLSDLKVDDFEKTRVVLSPVELCILCAEELFEDED